MDLQAFLDNLQMVYDVVCFLIVAVPMGLALGLCILPLVLFMFSPVWVPIYVARKLMK